MADDELLEGLIIRAQSGFFEVATSQGIFTAEIRGRLKQPRRDTDLAALGDRVRLRLIDNNRGQIDSIEPRRRVLSRRDPGSKREQVLVANPDQAVFVLSAAEPAPLPRNRRLLDRFLVVAERERLPASIVVNKIDLTGRAAAAEPFLVYPALGYPVLLISAKTGEGVEDVRDLLAGKISVLAGPSGTGKSSLLNAIQPGLGLATREISRATTKGKHTTVFPALVPLEVGGYVADTPGVKAFGLWDVEPDELDAYFRELAPLVTRCAFSDCTHLHEPGCAVLAAVADGRVAESRYDSYRRMRMGEE
ncbi:MAG TPA: ribosome small subunit-dependent GTPase A [Anaerolineales bacterium]|nr:ribosome small subunit-dependent GTPase A [Anaerolineales bacterium]